MREPWFWRDNSLTARITSAALTPAAALYNAGRQLRLQVTNPQKPPMPVICIGNATVGGVGKTPFALMVHRTLADMGVDAHFLTRGYGGNEPGPLRVDAAKHTSIDVGDEALLLARRGSVWVSRNRPTGAQAAHSSQAPALIMDDGYQNPSLAKTLSILLVSSSDPWGNGKLLPAGPLREPIENAIVRADLIASVGVDEKTPAPDVVTKSEKPFLQAWLTPKNPPPPQKVIAFSGIGKPEKFYALLDALGFDVAKKVSFPDHHVFRSSELSTLTALAQKENAALITTEKDHVRLPTGMQKDVLTLPVEMTVSDPDLLRSVLSAAVDAPRKSL